MQQCVTMYNIAQQRAAMSSNMQQCAAIRSNVQQISTLYNNMQQHASIGKSIHRWTLICNNLQQYVFPRTRGKKDKSLKLIRTASVFWMPALFGNFARGMFKFLNQVRAGVLLHTIEEKPVSRILPHGFHMVLNSHGSETIWSTNVASSNHVSNTPWVVCGFEQSWLPL